MAAENNASVVVLGHGSFDEATRFHHYFPLEHLYVSEDHAAFEALPLKRGGVLDFINPLAAITAFGSAGRALSQPGVLESKKEQVLPQSDFWQLGGLFHLGPGEACGFHRIEQSPGDHLSVPDLLVKLNWGS